MEPEPESVILPMAVLHGKVPEQQIKKCTYCGKEYPLEAAACVLDGRPLKKFTPPTPAPKTPVTLKEAPAPSTTPSQSPRQLPSKAESLRCYLRLIPFALATLCLLLPFLNSAGDRETVSTGWRLVTGTWQGRYRHGWNDELIAKYVSIFAFQGAGGALLAGIFFSCLRGYLAKLFSAVSGFVVVVALLLAKPETDYDLAYGGVMTMCVISFATLESLAQLLQFPRSSGTLLGRVFPALREQVTSFNGSTEASSSLQTPDIAIQPPKTSLSRIVTIAVVTILACLALLFGRPFAEKVLTLWTPKTSSRSETQGASLDPDPTGTWYAGDRDSVYSRLVIHSSGAFTFQTLDFTGDVKGGYSGRWSRTGSSIRFEWGGLADRGTCTGYKSGPNNLVFGATTFGR